MLGPILFCCAFLAAVWAIMKRRVGSAAELPSLLDATLDDLVRGLARGRFTSA
jgi:hypothetical protein